MNWFDFAYITQHSTSISTNMSFSDGKPHIKSLCTLLPKKCQTYKTGRINNQTQHLFSPSSFNWECCRKRLWIWSILSHMFDPVETELDLRYKDETVWEKEGAPKYLKLLPRLELTFQFLNLVLFLFGLADKGLNFVLVTTNYSV